MRSLVTNADYFVFLDALRNGSGVSTMLAAVYLAQEYPNLQDEETKAIYTG